MDEAPKDPSLRDALLLAATGFSIHRRDGEMDALLDAAHAYGLAAGRSGFVPSEDMTTNAYAHSPHSLRASIDTIGRAVDFCDRRLAEMEESLSIHLKAITHLEQVAGEPAWTKADLDALLKRVVALEQGTPGSLADAHYLLQKEKAEHAETLRRYEERSAELEREKGLRAAAEGAIREVIEALPYGDIKAFVDEPPF